MRPWTASVLSPDPVQCQLLGIVLTPIKTLTVNRRCSALGTQCHLRLFCEDSTAPMHVTLFRYRFFADAISKDEVIRVSA